MPRDEVSRRAGAYALEPGRRPPPRHLHPRAKRLWAAIVADRPADFFRPGSFGLLAQYCTATAEGAKLERALAGLACDHPSYAALVALYAKLGALRNATAQKLRLSTQADYRRDSRRVAERRGDDEVPGGGDDLLAGEEPGWAFPSRPNPTAN